MHSIHPSLLPGNPGTIADIDFPQDGTAKEKLTFLLKYAVLAPSGHNRQPWNFRIQNDVVELLADRSRALPAIDPDDREMIMSCGAALFHLRLALRHFGHSDGFTGFPDPSQPDLIARVRLGGKARASADDERMFQAIQKRRTFRHPFLDHPLPEALIGRLGNRTRLSDVWLHFVEQKPEREEIAELIAEGERRQLQHGPSRRELLAWIHPDPQFQRDGIPGYALQSTPRVRPAGPLLISSYEPGKEQAARDRHFALSAPALVVLGTTLDQPRNWLRAGQALAETLLWCAAEGVYASFLNQPIQVADLRHRVLEVIGRKGHPQIILRLGYGAEATPTPRRPVAEVLLSET